MIKKKKRRKKRLTRKPAYTQEILAVACLGIAVFLLVSLFSLQPNEKFINIDSNSINSGGIIGTFLSSFLFRSLGFSSLFLPLILIVLGIRGLFFKEKIFPSFFVWGLFLTFITASLLHAFFAYIPWKETQILTGGRLGQTLELFLEKIVNRTGTIILLVTAFITSLTGFSRISLSKTLRFIGRILYTLFNWVRILIVSVFSRIKPTTKAQKQLVKHRIKEQKKAKEPKKPKPVVIKPPVSIPPEKETARESVDRIPRIQPPLIVTEPRYEEEEAITPKTDTQKKGKGYQLPPLNLLERGKTSRSIDEAEIREKKEIIEERLSEFKVNGEVHECHPGPVITCYDFYPSSGIKVKKVANLNEELALSLSAQSIRIHRTPGKPYLSVETPNRHKEIIQVRDIIESRAFQGSESKLTYALGKDVEGKVYVTDITDMPHLLIAGATGTGKSVALNSLIISLLYKSTPEELKLILIDPKRIELTVFDGIPHLLAPVVQDPRKAEPVLNSAIKEMEDRYNILNDLWVKNINQYNSLFLNAPKKIRDKIKEKHYKPFPHIVIIIDELAELMMVGAKEIEQCIARLAQMARAVGIHLVLATQRPSIEVITGLIKNNFPSRIAFRVPALIDSRVILDTPGAEHLLGDGDMLFIPPKNPKLTRLHGSYVSLSEIQKVVEYVKAQQEVEYDEKLLNIMTKSPAELEFESVDKDELFDEAVALILSTGQASASFLQRRMSLGYARAARLIDQMEAEGIVGQAEGSKKREIIIDAKDYFSRK